MAGEGIKGPASLYRIVAEGLKRQYKEHLKTFFSIAEEEFEAWWAKLEEIASSVREYLRLAKKAERRKVD